MNKDRINKLKIINKSYLNQKMIGFFIFVNFANRLNVKKYRSINLENINVLKAFYK